MRNSLLFVFALFGVYGCYKDELPVPAHDPGDATEVQIEMGQDYRYQLFYSLEENEVVRSNDKIDWDLGFESAADGWHIILNSSRGMAVHHSLLGYGDITSGNGLDWNWDVSSGNLDSTAFGDWQSDNFMYVIDMGYDHTGTHQGYRKMKVLEMNTAAFTIEYCDISATVPETITIEKNPENLFTFYSFDAGAVTIAPPNEQWDLEFTQYTQLFTNPLEPYLVTGVLLNRYTTEAARVENKSFADITFEDAQLLTYSDHLDYIGYDWKTYDYENQVYTVDPSMTYIVHTQSGVYYKLHFIDFYNDLGVKGYPRMEIQAL